MTRTTAAALDEADRRDSITRAGRAAREPFSRGVVLPGWSDRSRWGYDAVLECYWVEMRGAAGAGTPPVRIGSEHLLTTIAALARALARAADVEDADAFLALTA
ncbi:MAG: hypothetical protein HGA44_04480 [Cellulomonadaceae bacterium]|nr:hypothetical protein [Cellulomonadaceae bacterium]